MTNGKPQLNIENHTPSLLVAKLHTYFSDFYDYYEIEKGKILNSMATVESPEKEEELKQKLQQLNGKVTYLGALSDALSVADRLLHAKGVITDLELDQEMDGHSDSKEP